MQSIARRKEIRQQVGPLPTVVMDIVAAYATTYREIFLEWLAATPVGLMTNLGTYLAERVIDIHVFDHTTNQEVKKKLKIWITLRGSFAKNRERAFASASFVASSLGVVLYTRIASFDDLWKRIQTHTLSDQETLRATNTSLVNGIREDVMRTPLAEWRQKVDARTPKLARVGQVTSFTHYPNSATHASARLSTTSLPLS